MVLSREPKRGKQNRPFPCRQPAFKTLGYNVSFSLEELHGGPLIDGQKDAQQLLQRALLLRISPTPV
jgi:hypothetical protein